MESNPPPAEQDDEDDVMAPVIIPAQPGWFAKRKDDASHLEPIIAWVIFSVARIGDEPRAIGAVSGKLDAGWFLEYNPSETRRMNNAPKPVA